MLERTTTGVLSCGNTKTEARPCGCYRQRVWMPVDVAACDCAAARRHGANDTRSCDRKQDQPMTKNSELGCQQTPFR